MIHDKEVLVEQFSTVWTKDYREFKHSLVAENFGYIRLIMDKKVIFIRNGVEWVINKAYPRTKD